MIILNRETSGNKQSSEGSNVLRCYIAKKWVTKHVMLQRDIIRHLNILVNQPLRTILVNCKYQNIIKETTLYNNLIDYFPPLIHLMFL